MICKLRLLILYIIVSDMNIEKLEKLTDTELAKIYPKEFLECLKDLDHELPAIPEIPVVEQENPPPFLYPRETIGSRAPKSEDGGNKKGKKSVSKKKEKSPK